MLNFIHSVRKKYIVSDIQSITKHRTLMHSQPRENLCKNKQTELSVYFFFFLPLVFVRHASIPRTRINMLKWRSFFTPPHTHACGSASSGSPTRSLLRHPSAYPPTPSFASSSTVALMLFLFLYSSQSPFNSLHSPLTLLSFSSCVVVVSLPLPQLPQWLPFSLNSFRFVYHISRCT